MASAEAASLKARRKRDHLKLPTAPSDTRTLLGIEAPTGGLCEMEQILSRHADLATMKSEDLVVCDERLGEGSQGFVDKAIHKPTGMAVALKTIKLDPSATPEAQKLRQELYTEVKTYMQSQCPYVLPSYGCWLDQGRVVCALEYMDCGSLGAVIQRGGAVPEAALSAILKQIVLGLEYLHRARHLVHRDLKPTNILMNSDGEVKIADFGVSRELENTLANCNTFVGTILYMSPERINTVQEVAGYGHACDIWSAGLVAVECALGKYPYPKHGADQLFERMMLVCTREVPLDEWLPPGKYSDALRSFVRDTMLLDPAARPSASTLLSHPFLALGDTFDLVGFVRDKVLFA